MIEQSYRDLVKIGDFNELKAIVKELPEQQKQTSAEVRELAEQQKKAWIAIEALAKESKKNAPRTWWIVNNSRLSLRR